MVALKRRGFTLTELLVVLFILALLASLLAFVMPGFRERSRAAKGGQAVQGWLTYARQRAMLDQVPTGVRFTVEMSTTSGTPVCKAAEYIAKPDDFTMPISYDVKGKPSNGYMVQVYPPVPNEVMVKGANFRDGSAEVGDNLELRSSGVIYNIAAIVPSDPVNSPNIFDKLILNSNLDNFIYDEARLTNYRIIRRPRVLGDQPELMPTGIVIDLAAMATYAGQRGTFFPTINTNSFDVLFSPDGKMLESPSNKLILWVRNEVEPTPFDGNPTLIVAYSLSGAVAAYSPGDPADPYAAIR